jgi:mannose-6-phosphate isomerase-like protein (cupin superfamily)
MPNKVRRVVTHVNPDGTSGATESIITKKSLLDPTGTPVFEGVELWGTDDGVPTVGGPEQPDAVFVPFFPGPGGHRFVVFSFMPEVQDAADTEPGSAHGGSGGAAEDPFPGLMQWFSAERPGWHRTDTLDYVYVVSGQMYLETDDGEILVSPGDTVVDRGAGHAWRNRFHEPCVVVAVLLGAERKE